MAILQAELLPLQSGSDQLENEQTGARPCDIARPAPGSLSQAYRAFQNREGSVALDLGPLAAFSQRADSLDGCLGELDCRRNSARAQQDCLVLAAQTASHAGRRDPARYRGFGTFLLRSSFH